MVWIGTGVLWTVVVAGYTLDQFIVLVMGVHITRRITSLVWHTTFPPMKCYNGCRHYKAVTMLKVGVCQVQRTKQGKHF